MSAQRWIRRDLAERDLDSSAVVAAVADLARRNAVDRTPKDWRRTFVACFPGTRLDERAYAEQVVVHAGARAAYCALNGAMAVAKIERDGHFDLGGLYPTPLDGPWAVYRAIRRSGIPVGLEGHGADELPGGYHCFVDQAILERMGRRFRHVRYRDLRRVCVGLDGATVLSGSREKLGGLSVLYDFRAAFRTFRSGRLLEAELLRRRSQIPAAGPSMPTPHPIREIPRRGSAATPCAGCRLGAPLGVPASRREIPARSVVVIESSDGRCCSRRAMTPGVLLGEFPTGA